MRLLVVILTTACENCERVGIGESLGESSDLVLDVGLLVKFCFRVVIVGDDDLLSLVVHAVAGKNEYDEVVRTLVVCLQPQEQVFERGFKLFEGRVFKHVAVFWFGQAIGAHEYFKVINVFQDCR